MKLNIADMGYMQPGECPDVPGFPFLKKLLIIPLFILITLAAHAQQVSVVLRSGTLIQAMKEIEKQTGYTFTYTSDQLQRAVPVNIQWKKVPLATALDVLFKTQPLTYSIRNRNIIIAERHELPATLPVDSVKLLVHGRVYNEQGVPIPGVTLMSMGVKPYVTNEKGEFELNVAKGAKIQLTHISYVPKELQISSFPLPEKLSVVLSERSTTLGEIVVNKGYYTTTKKLNTGNIATVSAKEIEAQPVTNVLQALQSRVPGLIITQQSGNPGSNFTIQLRGKNSINKSNPLFIIDGVPFNMDALGQVAGSVAAVGNSLLQQGAGSAAGLDGLSPLNSINPDDIESVEVLKDADATSIYGSRGANGVILITTKKGKPGPLSVRANFSTGFSNPSRMPEFMTTEEYLRYRRLVFRNDGKTPGVADLDLNGTWDTTSYTKWGEQLIGRSNNTTRAGVSLSGGNAQTSFNIGLGYTTVSPPYDGNFSDDRTSLSFSIANTSNNKKLRISLSGNYSNEQNTLPGLDIASFVNLPPNAPSLLKEDGSLNWWSASAENPYASLLKKYKANSRYLQGNGMVSYQLLPSLLVRATLGYSDMQFNETRTNPLKAINPALAGGSSSLLIGSNGTTTWIVEPQAEFRRKMMGGELTVLAGTTFQNNLNKGNTISGTGFTSDAMLGNISAASRFIVSNRYAQYRYNAVFGRINYTLKDKYVLNLTGRRDGSSRFAPGRQFGNFGAVGAAWIFSDEAWAKQHLSFISFGKLRASYGITGNDQIGDYRYLDSYTAGNGFTYLGTTGMLPSRLFNEDYGWESNRKLEVAAELGFVDDRLMLNTAWYRNRSSSQLVQVPLAPTTGNVSVQANLPALIQNTGWEFDVTSHNIKNKNFSWSTRFNISIDRNKLIAFPGLELSSYAEKYVVGRSLNITTPLYHMIGVDPTTGLYEFTDKDGKPTSLPTVAVRTERIDLTQEYYGGLGNSFRYKSFQLDVQLQFVKQLGRSGLFNTNLPFSTMTNMPAYYLNNIWVKEGDITTLQKLSGGGLAPGAGAVGNAAFAALSSDGIYSDASYIRCKNVALYWQVKQDWLRMLRIKQASIYAQAQNLFTITNYMGFDPESQGSVLPPLRTLVFGCQFTL